jgi:predicted DNA-binding protein with PD1-like motif
MKTKLIHQADGRRTFAVVLQTGDEAITEIKSFAQRENLSAAQLTAIGAVSDAVLGYFDWERKEYQRIPVREQAEIASFIADIALDENGKPSLHTHVVLGRRDGSAPLPGICSRRTCGLPLKS